MKRVLVVGAIIIGVIVVLGAIAFLGVGFYLSPQSNLAKTDAIVAVSGGDTVARTDEAVELWKEHWAPYLIFSGAALDPSSPSNAAEMATLAEADGVPKDVIFLDQTSSNTEANASDVTKIIQEHSFHSIILVTSPYHQRRAYIVFHRDLGKSITILNQSSLDPDWRRSDWWATDYSRELTISEFQKTIYELFVK